jgi:hypothetical protein
MELKCIATYLEEMKHKCGNIYLHLQIEAIYFVSFIIIFMFINSNYGNVISLINIAKKKL